MSSKIRAKEFCLSSKIRANARELFAQQNRGSDEGGFQCPPRFLLAMGKCICVSLLARAISVDQISVLYM